jgi:hypothetical protein
MDNEDRLDLFQLLTGFWLLAHDLADRAIHAVSLEDEKSYLGMFLRAAHISEMSLKDLIRSELGNLGLATKEDLDSLTSDLENLRIILRSKRG